MPESEPVKPCDRSMHVAQKVLAANMFIPPPMASSVIGGGVLLAVWLPIQSKARRNTMPRVIAARRPLRLPNARLRNRKKFRRAARAQRSRDMEWRPRRPPGDSEMADLREVVKKPGMVEINRKALAEICEEKSPADGDWRISPMAWLAMLLRTASGSVGSPALIKSSSARLTRGFSSGEFVTSASQRTRQSTQAGRRNKKRCAIRTAA